MANFIIFFVIIIVLLVENSFQSENNNLQFVCGASKFLSKCNCAQETDKFEHIPLFTIDCSRTDFKESPQGEILPLLMGHLDLSHNKITYLNNTVKLSSTTLYYLDYSYNKIKFISNDFFANLSELIELNLGHNKLENIDQNIFNGLTKLKVLNLQSNKLKTLPDQVFYPLKNLEDISVSYNHLGKFIQENGLADFVPKSVKTIYLEHIHLTTIDALMFEDQKHLKKLSIAYNPLKQIPYLPLSYLEYLDISGTNISNITSRNLMFHNLKILKMNRLPYLTKISDYTFFNLQKLEELQIEHCIGLQEMDPLSFGYLKGKHLDDNYTLKKFSVAYSGLIFLPSTFQQIFEKIDEIQLRGNFWNCDCKLSWFKHLKNNVKDINQIRCASPESEVNKTIHSITETMQCLEVKNSKQTDAYKPIQRWLFPLVGVLAIIVVILVSTLIYMGPYPKNAKNPKFGMPGPESTYKPISIQPNEAENLTNSI